MSHSRFLARVALTAAILTGSALSAFAQPAPSSDLDRFMEKVLARREVNRKTLNEYVLDEVESFEVLGPSRMPMHRVKREYTWYVRDGMHVRSPVRFDGVTVGESARDEYERSWIARERKRLERKSNKREVTVTPGGADLSPGGVPTEPRFVSEAYFMGFKFEPGNYLLAGRETLDGQEVLRIEYYPTRLFSDDDDRTDPEEPRTKERGDREREAQLERRMNKTALVTLWVAPANHQIVKYTFENVWLDFLPGAWLVRVDDIRASMTMGQPFQGVWLPKAIDIHAGFTLANGSYEVSLARMFKDYREAQVTTKVKIPSVPESEPERDTEWPRQSPAAGQARGRGPSMSDEESWQEAPPAEMVREVRVHGNAYLTDQEVLEIAGVAVGVPVGAAGTGAIEKRLKDSGLFESVEVRKRYRSLTDPTDVAVVLVVHERPGVRSVASAANPVARSVHRARNKVMFLPIVNYADGYGFTYGARLSTVDALGAGERLSVPLTWGGTKRAALEFERVFDRGPLTRITSSVGISNRENPRFDIDDQRVEFRAGAERQFAHAFRIGIDTSQSRVEFADVNDRQWTIGGTAAFDTRGGVSFPRDAVYLGAGWTGLHVEDLPAINRYTLDARGYARLIGQSVLAARAQYFWADAQLPPYERLLLGGSPTLRGFRPGSFDGDRLLLTSVEARVPITSVIAGAKLGVTIFGDFAKVTDHGTALGDAAWQRGAGAGVFLIASILRLNVDVAHGFDGGGTRVHLSSGFAF